ncbi:DUF6220 domain-containing protein [Plantactinospora sp. GCM10030261]|uniref:DUF6220 domain-containing protein n=1 Tax=Plantactinospora sp. GCM10030261 TaxID=3273420 RepID=UPI003622907C
MRRSVFGVAALLMLAVLAQFFLAASGAFDTAPNDESFRPHRMLGAGIVLLALLVTIVAAVARMPGRLVGTSGLVAGLAVLQFLISAIASGLDGAGGSTTAGEIVFGLHAINGLAILALVGLIVRHARQLAGPVARVPQTP